MGLYEKYNKQLKLNGVDIRERNKNRVIKDFETLLKTSANSYDVKFYEVEDIKRRHFEEDVVIIDDTAKVAETTATDEKKVMCKTSSNIKIGTYIHWNNLEWLVVSEDMVTTGAYKKFSILPCHLYITRVIEDRVVDYPVAYENINSNAFNQEIGANNSKFLIDETMEKIIIPNIEEIREIVYLNKRVMLNSEKVYKVKKEDTFQTMGIIYVTIQQDVLTEKDNKELNIAADINKPNITTPDIPSLIPSTISITGDKVAKIGTVKEYEIAVTEENDEFYEPVEIIVTGDKDIDSLVDDLVITNELVSFKVKKETKNINKKITIKAVMKLKDNIPVHPILPDDNRLENIEEEFNITIKGLI